jgi:hypothetical protein
VIAPTPLLYQAAPQECCRKVSLLSIPTYEVCGNFNGVNDEPARLDRQKVYKRRT